MKNNPRPHSNTTQLLNKYLCNRKWDGNILVAFPPETGLEKALRVFGNRLNLWHQDFSIYERDGQSGTFDIVPPRKRFDVVFVYWPKSKDYQELTLKLLLSELAPQATVLIVGAQESGAGSARPMLERAGLQVLRKDSARHCVLWECVAAVPTPRESFKFNRFEAKAWGKVIEVCSLPGVFSHGRLDAGSSFFLETLSTLNLEFDSALDWGCGAGAVGCLLKKFRSSASVVLADVSAPALESARETVRVNQLSGIQVVPSDGFSHLKGAQFDLIVSNPPAHKGFDSDFGATLNFLSTARNFMTPGGRLLLVANIQLPYLKVMKGNFKKTERLAVNRQFQILAGNN